MTLQQMEYIVALDKYRHFVLAAEACTGHRTKRIKRYIE
mgnify:CR=1 FL=1